MTGFGYLGRPKAGGERQAGAELTPRVFAVALDDDDPPVFYRANYVHVDVQSGAAWIERFHASPP